MVLNNMEKEDLKYLLLNFTKEEEIDEKKVELIMELYYNRRENMQNYKETKKRLTQLIIEGNFPNSREWNKIAQKEGLYSSTSIQYIENLNWKQLEVKIIREIKDILIDESKM